jgi:hypothetical protein
MLNDYTYLESLWQTAMAGDRKHMLDMIATIFHNAIDARSPKRRPPGKAGLRAEKGYYRLLYLESILQDQIVHRETTRKTPMPSSWQQMREILDQLKDIPELRLEIIEGIESALRRADPARN